ncbi:6-bladed beta-propeller [Membranicola marinus]|uniref:6-bladed beta-propeller n=1 Tax=Membranihabitans marinus TaxID=1227546 RepID=A0A953HQB3_9BACT|nr:6-bladed beta-propeller [Membranihabitans marinus]MBY5960234.1 6-bladed beta-propeller [Membranihabitans marinus]
MKNCFYILFLLSCLFSCKDQIGNSDIDSFLVHGENANPTLLSNIAQNVDYVSLKWPKGTTISRITDIKVYGNYIFIHDRDGTMTITVFDKQGNYVNRLNKIGKGPGEYLDLEAFSFDIENEILVTYSRDVQSFNFYTFPEMEFIRSLKRNKYIINFEVLKNGDWLVICDEEFNNKFHGLERWDEDHIAQPVNKLIKRDPITVEMSLPNTLTKNQGNIYYANPHEITTIFKFTNEDFTPVLEIDFGMNNIPSQSWETPHVEEFENTLEEGGEKSFWVQNAIINDSTVSFWFYYGGFGNDYLAICDKNTKECSVYSEVNLTNMNINVPAPITNSNDRYISLLYPDLMDTVGISTHIDLMNAFEESIKTSSPILVFFTLLD